MHRRPVAQRVVHHGLLVAGCLLLPGAALAKSTVQCERWAGWSSGNDSRVRLTLRLCHSARGVAGTARWVSPVSGSNTRRVVGRYNKNGKRLWLRDVQIIKRRPKNGWRFCLVDRYTLRRVGRDRLVGRYYSAACGDRATLKLRRQKAEKGRSK